MDQDDEKDAGRTMGQLYCPLEEIRDGISCSPMNGFLAEKFFCDTGLSAILDRVLGKERAFLVKVSAAVMATRGLDFEMPGLNEFPMKLHMIEEMDRFLSMDLWKSITDEEQKGFFDAWIDHVKPGKITSLSITSNITLFGDKSTDDYGGWLVRRIKRGTIYRKNNLVYRDERSGKMLAVESFKLFPNDKNNLSFEVNTVKRSDYRELQRSSLHFFLPPYLFFVEEAMKLVPISVWMRPSQFHDQEELKKKLKELENVEAVSGFRQLHWRGHFRGNVGNWSIMENVDRREWQSMRARNILNHEKRRLQEMSYYPAHQDLMSYYFNVDKDCEDTDFFDDPPFTVKFRPGATEKFRSDAGIYLHFTTDEPMDDRQLLRNFRREEDLKLQYTAHINQGQTADVADDYFEAMSGRELSLFLSSMYREWIYDHVGDLINEDYDIASFASETAAWRGKISATGRIEMDPFTDRIGELMLRFGITPEEVVDFISNAVKQDEYFSIDFAHD